MAATQFDAIVVGAGPAGLIAATYLGRYRRRTLVLDGGPSRAAWIPQSHNTPGFPAGVGGPELLERMREQASRYGADLVQARARDLLIDAEGCAVTLEDGEQVSAPFVLLAAGVIDRKPSLAGIDQAIRRSLVRICPICDAYEAIDRRIAVLSDSDLGVREALFLRHYSAKVSLLHTYAIRPAEAQALDAAGVARHRVAEKDLRLEAGQALAATPAGRLAFDHLYLALGCEQQSRLALRWGAAHDETDNLIVDAHQRTSLDRVYAAGDLVRGLNQIAVATAEAAIAATHIHNRLRGAA